MSILAVDLAGMLPALLPRLWTFALRLSGTHQDAEALVKRACEQALENTHLFPGDTSALKWMLFRVYTTWTHSQSQRGAGVPPDIEGGAQCEPAHRRTLAAVGGLSVEHRGLVLLVDIERMSCTEAAQLLGLPVSVIVRRLSQARQAVGAQVG
ncbi:RNA polymerase sigma factor [Pseudomonas sp. SDO528_S397]